MNSMTEAMLIALGARWRNDWSDFDGRTLRDQISQIIKIDKSEDWDAAAEFIEEQNEIIDGSF